METHAGVFIMIEQAQQPILDLVKIYKPRSFCEVGCHTGLTARWLCHEILKYHPRLTYVGYDAFEETPKIERNGKSVPNQEKIIQRLEWLKRRYKFFSYNLIKGYTSQTLTQPCKYGIVYIDGGHSYETVKHDYNMLRESKIVIFDDYNLPGVQQAVDEIGLGYQLEFNTPRGKNKKWVIIK